MEALPNEDEVLEVVYSMTLVEELRSTWWREDFKSRLRHVPATLF